jgi:HB1, ASXL, restriction endonuclease HTH domain
MTAKKNTVATTPAKTRRIRPRKGAARENLPTPVSASAEPVPVEAAPTAPQPALTTEVAAATTADPTTDSSPIGTPVGATETTSASTDHSREPPAPANKYSALDAAAQVLAETGQAMSCPELIAAMAAKGYWQSPKGRTPAGTLYSAFLRELQTKGEQARFCKTGRGRFALRDTV